MAAMSEEVAVRLCRLLADFVDDSLRDSDDLVPLSHTLTHGPQYTVIEHARGQGVPVAYLAVFFAWPLRAILALRANSIVAIDDLIEGLWGEQPPETAAKALQMHVSTLRKSLEQGGRFPRTLLTAPRGYVIPVGASSSALRAAVAHASTDAEPGPRPPRSTIFFVLLSRAAKPE